MEDKRQWIAILAVCGVIVAVLLSGLHFIRDQELRGQWVWFEEYNRMALYQDRRTGARVSFLESVHGVVAEAHPGLTRQEERYGYQWDGLLRHYRPLVAHPGLAEERFVFLVGEMLSLLDDPGTRVLPVEGIVPERNLLIHVTMTDTGLRLVSYSQVYREFEDYISVLEPGDRLVRIDDRNAGDLYEVLLEDTIFGTLPAARALFEKRFFMTYYDHYLVEIHPEFCKLEFRKPSGQTYTLWLDWNEARGITGANGVLTSVDRNRETVGEYIQETNLAYIRMNGFLDRNLSVFESELSRMRNTSGLILDLRGADRIAGTPVEKQVLGYFAPRETVLFQETWQAGEPPGWYRPDPPDGDGPEGFPQEPRPVVVEPAVFHYGAPVVVLVDENYMEAPDALIQGLRMLSGAAVVGRITDLRLEGHRFRVETPFLPHAFSVSTSVLQGPGGEAVGGAFAPDVAVPMTREEAEGSHDPVLRAGIEWLARETGPVGEDES